jgi:unsaturated chondroitin disaccharide hydrolase
MTDDPDASDRTLSPIREAIVKHAVALAPIEGFPTWTDGGRWRTVPVGRPDSGILPHDGSWMVGDLPAIMWFAGSFMDDGRLLSQAARERTRQLENRLAVRSFASMSHLFFRSAVVGASVSRDETMTDLAARAAAAVRERFDQCGYMKSFGNPIDGAYPFTTIDDVINLVLPLWYAQRTDDGVSARKCLDAIETVADWLIRPDGSTSQVLRFDQGRPDSVASYQGREAGSCWSRGLAWGIYGFTAAYRVSRHRSFRDAAIRMSDYWMANVRDDAAPPWDFDVHEPMPTRDSFAASLAYAGMLELASISGDATTSDHLQMYAHDMVLRLWAEYGRQDGDGLGILTGAALDVPHGYGVDCSVIVGDSYFAECIWRLNGGEKLWPDGGYQG